MQVVEVKGKKEQSEFLAFRKRRYKNDALYIDNNYFMLQEIFAKKLHFVKSVNIHPVMVCDESGEVLCEAVIAFAKDLPEYIQICFFESLPGQSEAVRLIVSRAEEKGKYYKCSKIVIGLFGHVNYGLGLLNSHYDSVNSFSSPGNPKYYNEYFESLGCETVLLNSYFTHNLEDRLSRYGALIRKLRRKYEFKTFDKHKFEYYSKIYTDLNNACFTEHKYYYHREYEDDMEMLKELFLFMKEDSLFFAFKDGKPVGFILWYPDYNELAKPGELFGTKHFFLNKLKGKNIRTAKVMEWGVLEEYRGCGLPVALTDCVYQTLKTNYRCSQVESSWILDENEDSNSICMAICDGKYKEYIVYEKAIG